MPYQPDKVGPALLAAARQTLAEAGFNVAHLTIAYDGSEAEAEEGSYSQGFHYFPNGDPAGHAYVLSTALRPVAPRCEHGSNGLFIRYFDDGTAVVAPAHVGGMATGDEEDDDDE